MTGDWVEWQVAVFCQNEASRIAGCLDSIAAAIGGRRALITVIVNGSTDDSAAAAHAASAAIATPVQIFTSTAADKANAINCFLNDRHLRVDADTYFFVDGYVTIGRQSLEAIAVGFAEHPDALAASGIAVNGRTEARTSRAMVAAGGVLKGQFYALTADFVRRIAEAGIALPVGLYRGDGLLGSMAAHDLDAIGQPWVNERVIGVAGATFEIDALSLLRWQDWRRQFRRKVRQMRGLLENAAIKQVIYAGGYTALPRFADDMIRDYLARNKAPRVSLQDRLFMALALRQHRAATRPTTESLSPTRVV